MVLGLPEGVTACLFDLDGVLTDTAAVHDAAWKQTFDDFLQERADREDAIFHPVRPTPTTSTTSTANRDRTGFATSWPAAASHLPEGSPDDQPTAETVNGVGNREERRAARPHPRRRGQGLRGLPPLPRGGTRRRASTGRRVLQRQHRGRPGGDRARRARRAAGRRGDDPRGGPDGQAGPRHLSRRRPAARRRGGGRGRLRGCARRRRGRASRPVRCGGRGRPGRAGGRAGRARCHRGGERSRRTAGRGQPEDAE